MCMSILPACIHVHSVGLVPMEERNGCQVSGTRVKCDCEPPCGNQTWLLSAGAASAPNCLHISPASGYSTILQKPKQVISESSE